MNSNHGLSFLSKKLYYEIKFLHDVKQLVEGSLNLNIYLTSSSPG